MYIGYCFGQDLRRKFGNSEYTSLAHVEEDEGDYDSSQNGELAIGSTRYQYCLTMAPVHQEIL